MTELDDVRARAAADPAEFLRWAADHPRWRFAVSEALAEVCAKPPELAARVLELIAEELAEG